MMVGAITSEKRARNICLVGLVLQVILGLSLLLLSLANQSIATLAASRYLFGGTFIWFVLMVLYHQRCQVAEEALETEQLKREREASGSTALFELEQEDFLIAQKRLGWMYKWLLPVFVLLLVAYLLIGHFFWPESLSQQVTDDQAWQPVKFATLSMFFVAGVAFIAYLFSRYVSGMSRDPQWRVLRSGSIYLFGNAVVCLALVICLGVISTKMVLPERVLAHVVRYLLLVLGLEFLVNFVLNFYRPRAAGELVRPAFESRLIGMISEPGSIAKSIADAVNYQFGFEVSTTWFYKMLERAVMPLVALSIVVLVGMTSFVVVDADELAVIERWGQPLEGDLLGPGLHVKWPWPVERVRDSKVSVGLIREMVIGEVKSEGEKKQEEQEVITWTDEHTSVPYVDVLVATTRSPTQSGGRASDSRDVAVSILWVSMPVQYRVKADPEGFYNYLYNYAEPEDMLRDVAYRELVKQAVKFDYQKIMSEDRAKVTAILHSAIQKKCDDLQLGMEIVFVGLNDIHPPSENDVAATFQKVATAEREKDTLIQAAQIDYTTTLVEVAGDVEWAEELYDLIQEKDDLNLAEVEARAQIQHQIEKYVLGDPDSGMLPIRGIAGQRLAESRAIALRRVHAAAAKAKNFDLELVAYNASPSLYRMRKVLQVLSGELDHVRKYVVMVDPTSTNIIIEVDEREGSGLEIVEPSQAN